MVRSSALLVAVSALTLSACGGTKVVNTSMSMGAFASALEGSWSDEGGAVYSFEKQGSKAVVVSIVDTDGERFQVVDPGSYNADGFTWIYSVPSTGYVVSHRITGISGQSFTAQWNNQHDTGESQFDKR